MFDKEQEFRAEIEEKYVALYEALVKHNVPAFCNVIYANTGGVYKAAKFFSTGNGEEGAGSEAADCPARLRVLEMLSSSDPIDAATAGSVMAMVASMLNHRVNIGDNLN